jgi:hypothetical protein
MSAPKHAALFRDSLGGLTIRHFPSTEDAQKHNAGRELAPLAGYLVAGVPMPSAQQVAEISGRGDTKIRSSEFAHRLGIHSQRIRDLHERCPLPGAIEHGPRTLMIPLRHLRLAHSYGLRGLERLIRTGLAT